jgi:hypothetical protein
MAEEGRFEPPWRAEGNKLPTSFHFKIFFGFIFDAKLRDLGFRLSLVGEFPPFL